MFEFESIISASKNDTYIISVIIIDGDITSNIVNEVINSKTSAMISLSFVFYELFIWKEKVEKEKKQLYMFMTKYRENKKQKEMKRKYVR